MKAPAGHEVTVRVRGYKHTYRFPPAEVQSPLTLRELARRYVERHTEYFGLPTEEHTARIVADTFGGRAWFRFGAGIFDWNVST